MEGYQRSGYKNQDKFFHNDHALTLVFRKTIFPTSLKEAVILESTKKHFKFCRLHPYYVRDISILYRDQEFRQEDEDFVFKYVKKLAGKLVIRMEELKHLRCEYNQRHNRMYRVYWQSCTFAFSKKLLDEFHDRIVDTLSLTRQLIILSFKQVLSHSSRGYFLYTILYSSLISLMLFIPVDCRRVSNHRLSKAGSFFNH